MRPMSLKLWIESHPRNGRGAAVAMVAAACAVGRAAVTHWANGIRSLPLEQCPAIERVTGVPCEALRSDVEWQREEDGRVSGYLVRV